MSEQKINDFIENILNDLKSNNYLYASQIPNIDLYMDQVTTFMDERLDLFKRSDEDKTLTKTMINNYSKSQLLPPTNRKKYSRNHMLMLLMIYYLKPVLSIPDIQAMLDPIQKIILQDKSTGLPLNTYYDTLVQTQLDNFDEFSKELMRTVDLSKNLFPNVDEAKNETLSAVTIIYMLSLQASIQKHIVTQLIDEFLTPKKSQPNVKNDDKKEPKKEERKEKKKEIKQ